MLTGKNIVIGVSGGIAAYKIPNLVSMLVKQHAEVTVIMTHNATNFITPITFESLTHSKCLVDTFDRDFEFDVKHVSVAKKADLCLIAPATANVIGKIAGGIADDMLTTTVMAMTCKVMISPAMNTAMYQNPILQDNLKTLRAYGYDIITPESGFLACGDVGSGRMPEPSELFEYILRECAFEKDLKGKKVVVSAGATRESIDPVRFITNHSTGKMGCAIAKMAMLRGAKVSLVAAHMEVEPPPFVKLIDVQSAAELAEAVKKEATDADMIFMTAAVADYTPVTVADDKIKKSDGDMSIPLKRTEDVLAYLGSIKKPGQILCGFSMETKDLVENSSAKLTKKNADMIVANNLKVEGAGFGTDTNVVTIITKDGATELPIMSKGEVAMKILDIALAAK